jgi:hypothetical protein
MPRLLSRRIHSPKVFTVFRTRAGRRVAVAAFATLSLVLVAAAASAEPFTITSGSFAFRWDSSVPVEVSGPAFRVTNADTNPEDFGLPGLAMEHASPSASTLPVSGHTQLNLSARLILTGPPPVELLDGVLFDLTFTGPSAVARMTNETCAFCPVISATAPFHLTGVLTAGVNSPGGVFRRDIVGNGTATVGFFRELGTGTLRPFATYNFAPTTTPTPEPGSLMLLASGGVWLLRRKVTGQART